MITLDEDTITDLIGCLKPAKKACPLLAIEGRHTVLVTNGAVVFEWPKRLVVPSRAYSNLLANQADENAKSAMKLLGKGHWENTLFPGDRGGFLSAEMVDPTKKEVWMFQKDSHHLVVFEVEGERTYYDHTTFDAIDLVAPDAEFQIFRYDENAALKVLAIYDDGVLIGAGANSLL